MEAQAWTAIGLLAATLLGTLFYLGNRIDSLGARLDSRMDSLGARLDSRFDGLDTRIDSLGARLDSGVDGLTGRIDGLSSRIDGLSERVRDQGNQLAVLTTKLDDHVERHAG